MRIILIIISVIFITEAGSDAFLIKYNQPLSLVAFEGAAEEEIPVEKDNLNPDSQITENFIYSNDINALKQHFSFTIKHNLPFISHTIFSPPPEC